MRPPEPDPLPLCVDVINGWPLNPKGGSISLAFPFANHTIFIRHTWNIQRFGNIYKHIKHVTTVCLHAFDKTLIRPQSVQTSYHLLLTALGPDTGTYGCLRVLRKKF